MQVDRAATRNHERGGIRAALLFSPWGRGRALSRPVNVGASPCFARNTPAPAIRRYTLPMRGLATFAPTPARPGETVSQRSARPPSARARRCAPPGGGRLQTVIGHGRLRAAGGQRHLYGQGKPNTAPLRQSFPRRDPVRLCLSAAPGRRGLARGGSASTTGEVQVESRLFYQGTVEGGGTANELSRLTDAREKGRIGILGSALAYAGLAGRVTSESIGRDLNPLGRGDGRAYVAGQLNLGRISPRLPGNIAAVGTGDSINNNEQQGLGGPSGPGGGGSAGTVGCACNPCCNFEKGALPCAHVEREDVDPCAAACDLCDSASGADCMDATCDCLTCQWHKYNADPCHFVPPFQEALCENGCCCPGCPCYGSGGNGGGVTGGGGCPGCGGTTGPWGPIDNGGGGGMPGFPPGWGIPGGGVTGPWRPLGTGHAPGDQPPHVWEPPFPVPPGSPIGNGTIRFRGFSSVDQLLLQQAIDIAKKCLTQFIQSGKATEKQIDLARCMRDNLDSVQFQYGGTSGCCPHGKWYWWQYISVTFPPSAALIACNNEARDRWWCCNNNSSTAFWCHNEWILICKPLMDAAKKDICVLVYILLHELAHSCGKGNAYEFFTLGKSYGPQNPADATAMAILKCCSECSTLKRDPKGKGLD